MGPPFPAPERPRELAHRLIRETTSPQRQQVETVSDILDRYSPALRAETPCNIRRRFYSQGNNRRKIIENISKQRVLIASVNKFKLTNGYFTSSRPHFFSVTKKHLLTMSDSFRLFSILIVVFASSSSFDNECIFWACCVIKKLTC